MSIHDSNNKTLQDGNGTQTTFEFTFKIFKDSDLKVYKVDKETGEMGDPLELNRDYTVAINKVGEGGRVIFTEAPTEEQQAGIYRDIAITQPASIPVDTEYVEKTLENALDRACMIDQQQQEQINRCIQLPPFSNGNTPEPGAPSYEDVEVELPVPKAENVLAWDEEGKSLTNYDVKKEIADFEDAVDTRITNSVSDFQSQINTFTTNFAADLNTYKGNVDRDIATYKSEVNTDIAEFKQEINTTIADVSEAAAKINELEEAVQTAVEKAEIATEKADDAETAANNAAEQVTLATAQANRAQEIADEMGANYQSLTDFKDGFPAAQNLTSWARDDKGEIFNMPLDTFKAGNTPFIKDVSSNHKHIKILAPLFIRLDISDTVKKFYKLFEDLTLDVESALDTGDTLEIGKDYYLYLCYDDTDGFIWKVSLNSTYPDGYDADNSRKMGGFHSICRTVTASNAPQPNHPAIGFTAGDIIPNSIWAYNFKSTSGNEGKAFIKALQEWWYIYNISGTGTSCGSRYGATRTHTRNYHDFVEDLFLVGDKMIDQNGFACAMNGSNYKTAVSGATQPNPDTTGGHMDTAGKAMISEHFLEEGCGLQWQHTEGLSATGGSGWTAVDGSGAKGQSYGNGQLVVVGGYWTSGGYTGPRCRAFNTGSSGASASIGARGRSCHKEF